MRRLELLLPLILSACVNANPSLYLLDPVKVEPTVDASSERIGLREVRLPDYADDQRFVYRTEDGALVHDEEHRWADRPTRILTRTLERNLRDATSATVVSEPWPSGFEPTLVVDVSFDVMDGNRSDQVRMRGQYRIQREAQSPIEFEMFELQEAVPGETYGDVTRAVANGLATLAKMIAKDVP